MRDLRAFREAVTAHRRAAGRTQQQLARAVGLHPHALSHKLNAKGALLSARDAVAIISTLAEWGAITDRGEADRLLTLLDVPGHAVPEGAWDSEPLSRLGAGGERPRDVPPGPVRRLTAAPLPAPINTLIGREHELRVVGSALSESRLVTLVGVGGTGKTRLAIDAALRLVDDFADGTAFANMATTHDEALAPIVLARAIGLPPAPEADIQSWLAETVRDLQMLIVVDNVEQLRGVGSLLIRLLRSAPRLRLLVTSRIPLRVHGEHIIRVPPLSLPARGAASCDIAGAEAVRLFQQRARAAGAAIGGEAELAAVAEICVALDGLPLAIELAAARVPSHPPQELARRLRESLEVVSDGSTDRPARQRALYTTLDWSYRLLSDRAARFFRRLGVFVARFDAAAAAALTDEPLPGPDAERLLMELTEHSLLTVRPGKRPTFRMMQTVREYALRRLADSGELTAVRRSHLRYWVGCLPELRAALLDAPDSSAYRARLDVLQQLYPDVLAALEFGIEAGRSDGEVLQTALQLAVEAAACWVRGPGPAGEAMLLLDELVRLPTHQVRSQVTRAAALLSVAMLAYFTGRYRRCAELAGTALPLCEASGFTIGEAYALRFLGDARLSTGDAVGAEPLCRRAASAAEDSGNPAAASDAYNVLAEALRYQGRYGEAADAARRGIRHALRGGDPLVVSHVMTTLAETLRDDGQYRRARRLLCATLRRHERLHALRALAADLEALAATLSLEGAGTEVFTLVAAARRVRDETAMPLSPVAADRLDTALRPAARRSGPIERARAEALGWNAPTDDTIALALRLAQDPGRL
jgi:predicted ATPase